MERYGLSIWKGSKRQQILGTVGALECKWRGEEGQGSRGLVCKGVRMEGVRMEGVRMEGWEYGRCEDGGCDKGSETVCIRTTYT